MTPTPPDQGHEPNGCCNGKTHQGGGRCKLPAGWGTDHLGVGACKLHGGSTRNHRKAAGRQMAERELRRLGVPVDCDPQEALLGMVREAAGNVACLRSMVGELGEQVTQSVYVAGGGENVAEHVLVVMYREWCDRLVTYSAAAIRAGIAEREVRLAEQYAEQVAQVITALLDDPELGLDWERRELGRRVAARHLRALPAPVAEGAA